jgi:hypothetical protein
MKVIYDEETDILLFLNPTGEKEEGQKQYRSTVTVDFDIYEIPILLELLEASITLGIPKRTLRKLMEDRNP